MNTLSLFDGISCGQIAFERNGIEFDGMRESNSYFASEIKSIAIKVTQERYPNTIQVGDVCKLHYENDKLYKDCIYNEDDTWELGEEIPNSHIDMLIGGSPCQDFSMAGAIWKDYSKSYGLKGSKSSLFYEYLRLKKEINPKYFLLENVKMRKQSEKELNEFMGVKGIHIDSALVSYQHRERIYWTNIPNVEIPKDKHISFQSYKSNDEIECDEAKTPKTPSRIRMWGDGIKKYGMKSCYNTTNENKIHTLTRKQDRCPNSGLIAYKDFCRFLTRSEIEQAQTLPLGYTKSLSYNQMQDVCGDGWTVDVIAHIFSYLPKEIKKE